MRGKCREREDSRLHLPARGGLAATNPAAAADRRCAVYNGAGGVDVALEHAPPSSSREGTTQPSTAVRRGVSAKKSLRRRREDGCCTCPYVIYMKFHDIFKEKVHF
jgi:hypothetical protein